MKDVKHLVEKLIKKHQTTDPNLLCRYLGIEIRYDYLAPIKGYFTKANRIKIITLDYDLEETEKDFVLSHEIAHALMHKELSYTFYHNFTRLNTAKVENEANIFAMYLILEKYNEELENVTTLCEISNITGISKDLLYKYL